MAASEHKLTGYSNLIKRKEVSKADERFEVIGTLDEAAASLGLAKALLSDSTKKELLTACQQDLSLLMAVLAGLETKDVEKQVHQSLSRLEEQLAIYSQKYPLPKKFIVAGENPASAALDLARTVVRRAERAAVRLAQSTGGVSDGLLSYLNRLSTLCFVLEISELETR